MTKQLILTFAVLCTLQARANVQPVQEDTVRHCSRYEATELLQSVQPVYLDGVVLPISRTGNWFVGIAGGATAFLGTPLGCEDLFGRVKLSYSLSAGKWFTPSVGARINYSGLRFKDAKLSSQDYHHIHADLLWNILGRGYARQGQVRWGLAPFAGVGLLHNTANGNNPFALSYGVQGQYRISRRVSVTLELSNTTTFQDFDGYGRPNRLGDHLLSLTAGFTFHLGKVGWKRAVDATPYSRRSERLANYASCLAEENRRYAGLHDRDRRALAELRKILEIEGLLDTYSHLFEDDDAARRSFPVNDYSGLNSLRARLKNRRWDGKSVFEAQGAGGDARTDSLSEARSSVPGSGTDGSADNGLSDDTRQSASGGNGCIGAPVYFFFTLNTARLTDASQMLNLDELARVAKKYGLSVKVTGAADSSTGTSAVNDSLSLSRAGFIAAELQRRGIPDTHIVRTGRGGIADAYTADDVVERYLSPADGHCFLSFAGSLIRQLRQIGKGRTADTYATAVNSFTRFREEKDIPLDEVDSDLMTAYETYLKSAGLCPNSTSFYMRNLRAIYNRAVEKELTGQRFPFRHVYTGVEKTVKRAVPLKVIRQIRDTDLTLHPDMDYARDLFLFSFYTRGMSFVDMAFLKKKDLQNGILSYRRHKTGQQLCIKWEAPMREIVAKYDTSGTPYLLPIIRDMEKDARRQYKNAAHLTNAKLKLLGRQLGLDIPLTTYVARHAWASIARSRNVPLSTISEAMGHDSENTTRIYLASLDTSVVDKANSLILKSL